MRRQTVLVVVSLVLLALPAMASAQDSPPVAGQTRSSATSAVQITDNPSPVRAHSSPQIAANPTNGELVVVEANVRGSKNCTIHISRDDGRTWFAGGTVMTEPFPDCTLDGEWGPYASLAFGQDGVLYVAFVGSEDVFPAPDLVRRHVFLARSTDGGITFTTTRVYEAPNEDGPARNKGPMLAVDPTDSDRVFVGWRHGEWGDEKLASMVAATTDGGQTFTEPVDVSGDSGGDYPSLAVDGDGTLHVTYWARVWPQVDAPEDTPLRPIYYLRSTDGGQTFSDQVAIFPGTQQHEKPPLITADPSTADLYVVWGGNAEPHNRAPDFEGDLDIFFLRSADAGDTWSEPRVVNTDGTDTDQSAPGISVAPDGRIDIAWYDDRHSPSDTERPIQDVYATWSEDGGDTFAPDARITDRSIDRSIGIWGNNIGSHHNVGVASLDNGAYVAWQDTRNADPVAQPEDIYMAKLPMAGDAVAGASLLTGPAVLWSLLGTGAGLALAGLLLVVGLWALRRKPAVEGA